MNPNGPIGIYVHIPFCVRKCNYCDFLSFPATEDVQENYVNSLCKQIDATDEDRSVASVYFGGGTPSVLDPSEIRRILCKLDDRFFLSKDAEITIEVNPGTVTERHLSTYRSVGINRLSIGAQSCHDRELKLLGRIHTAADFFHTFRLARAEGFSNINVDIMTALPAQTEKTLQETLAMIAELDPEHISAYSLILEENTPFHKRFSGEDRFLLPDEKLERALYYMTRDFFVSRGYEHYEISNFAKPGFFSRHNVSYWKRSDYIGLGLGASSLKNGERIKNTPDLNVYLEDPLSVEERTALTPKDCMEEFFFLGLRMMQGVSESDFYACFGVDAMSVYGNVIAKLCYQGLLRREAGRIFLTDNGVDYGNYVFSSFLL